MQRTMCKSLPFDMKIIEQLILSLGDEFNIRIVWNKSVGVFAITLGIVGTVVGGIAGGRLGAAAGAGLGAITGVGVGQIITLREVWLKIKGVLKEIYYIVYNFLRRLGPEDYIKAIKMLRSTRNKVSLALIIIEFIAERCKTDVYSSITTATV